MKDDLDPSRLTTAECVLLAANLASPEPLTICFVASVGPFHGQA